MSEVWLDFLGSGGRKTIVYNIPADGRRGEVPDKWEILPFGKAAIRREGSDISIVSLGVSVHRALEAASQLDDLNISSEAIDLRTISPLDKKAVCNSVSKTGNLLVVDEDYESFGLSGELAAILLEAGIKFKYGRVCTRKTIPYSREKEDETLPNVKKIRSEVIRLLK